MDNLTSGRSPTGRDELRYALEIIRAMGDNKDLLTMLVSMHSAGALACRAETMNGFQVKIWSARETGGFADHIVFMEDDLDALLAERFLDGTVAFVVISDPHPKIWWRRVEGQPVAKCTKLN